MTSLTGIDNIITPVNNLYALLSLLVRENITFDNAITKIRDYITENEGVIIEQEDGSIIANSEDAIAICFKTDTGFLGYEKLTGLSCVN